MTDGQAKQIVRLFIAFDTPEEVKRTAVELQEDLRPARADVSWEAKAKLHVTLKFLGDTPAGRVPEVSAALRKSARGVRPFEVAYHGLGTFPPRGVPRVLWIGVEDPTGTLVPLSARIEAEMALLGYPREDRPYHAHLTLGRVRTPRNLVSLQNLLNSCTFERRTATVNELMLVRSDLQPAGSVYTTLELLPLSV